LTEALRRVHALGVQHGDALRIGFVTRAHGLAGAIEVRLDWEGSQSLLTAPEVVLESDDGGREQHTVIGVRPTPKGLLLSLSGITDRNAAEERRGRAVLLPRTVLPELGPGEYYLSDLVGARVFHADGAEVGTVTEVQMYPSVDAVVIDSAEGNRWEQPLLDEWIARVDLEARRITLTSDGGLIEVTGNPLKASDELELGARKR